MDFLTNQFAAGFASAFGIILIFKMSKLKIKNSLARSNPYLKRN
jgi:hypothetical protein